MDLLEQIEKGIIVEVGDVKEAISVDKIAHGVIIRNFDLELIEETLDAVSIPVIASCRIGHYIEAKILEKIGVIEGISKEILDTVKTLDKVKDEIKASIPTNQNKAKKLALEIKDTIPVIYGFREYTGVAYRIKTQLNENSKMFCKFDVLPELNHNEIVGWENLQPNLAKILSVILLRSQDEPPEIKVRIETLKKILSQTTSNIHEIYSRGEKKLSKMFSTLYLGDYLSYYLAILNKVDPTPVKTINLLKEELKKKL